MKIGWSISLVLCSKIIQIEYPFISGVCPFINLDTGVMGEASCTEFKITSICEKAIKNDSNNQTEGKQQFVYAFYVFVR